MIDNEFVQKAEDELEYINADEEERMRAKFRERSEWKYHADMKSMFSAGKEEGVKDVAKKMLKQNIDIEVIIEVTGLTREEVEKLKD